MKSTEQITQNTQSGQNQQNQQTHQNHQPDLSRQTSQTNQSDEKDRQDCHPQAGNAPWPPPSVNGKMGQPAAEHCHAPDFLCRRRDLCPNQQSNTDPHNEMDLTAYLQTEGRRRAAELAGTRHSGDPGLPAPCSQAPQQCATAVDDPPPPQCLSEALRRMGVT